MNKKIIILIITILIVGVIFGPAILLFIFNSQESQLPSQSTTNNINDVGENNQNESKDNSELTELEFEEIDQPYKDGYAILRSDEKNSSGNTIYYFVDSNGKLVYQEGIYNMSHHKFMNGYFIRNYYNNNNNASIIDLSTGETVLQGTTSVSATESVSYGDISKNGYVVAVRKTESLSGETYKTNIEDLNGNVIYSVDKKVRYICPTADTFVFIDDDTGSVTLINAQTKKNVEVNYRYEYLENDEVYGFENYIAFNDFIVSVDLEKVYEKMPRMKNELNDQYYLSTEGITDFTGKVVYDFTDGGFTKVFYYDGIYYVLSKNDFRYTLDENFNFVAQPDKFYSSFLFTLKSNGVLSTGSGIGIRDKDLNKVQGIDLDTDTEDVDDEMTGKYIDGFVYIRGVYNGRSGATDKVYNLETNEFITFHK